MEIVIPATTVNYNPLIHGTASPNTSWWPQVYVDFYLHLSEILINYKQTHLATYGVQPCMGVPKVVYVVCHISTVHPCIHHQMTTICCYALLLHTHTTRTRARNTWRIIPLIYSYLSMAMSGTKIGGTYQIKKAHAGAM